MMLLAALGWASESFASRGEIGAAGRGGDGDIAAAWEERNGEGKGGRECINLEPRHPPGGFLQVRPANGLFIRKLPCKYLCTYIARIAFEKER